MLTNTLFKKISFLFIFLCPSLFLAAQCPSVAPITGTLLLCEGKQTTLVSSPAGGTWSSGDTNVATIDQNGLVTTHGAGETEIVYSVTENACTKTASVILSVDAMPVLEISENEILCKGAETQLYINGASQYIWEPADGLSDKYSDHPIATPEATITYTVTGMNGVCKDEVTVEITVVDMPGLDVRIDGGDIYATGNGGTPPYMYSLDEGIFAENEYFKSVKIGKHIVAVKDVNGCESEKTVEIEYKELVIPKAFSPNGDMVNDQWEIENITLYPDAEIEIYDRYGKALIKYKGSDPGWDGKCNDIFQPTTDYWYLVTIKEINKRYTGHFTLKR